MNARALVSCVVPLLLAVAVVARLGARDDDARLREEQPPATRADVYAVRYDASTRARSGPGAVELESDAHLVADVVLRTQAWLGTSTLVSLSLQNVTRVSWRVLGVDAFGEPPADVPLADAEVIAVLDEQGLLRELRFAPDAPASTRQLLRALALDALLPPRAPPAPRQERTPHGLATTSYRATAGSLERVREGYVVLDAVEARDAVSEGRGRARARREASGALVSLECEEELVVRDASGRVVHRAQTTLLLERVRSTADGDAGDAQSWLARTEVAALEAPAASSSLERRQLEHQAAGLTRHTLLAERARFGRAGRLPDHARWMWRATGLLRLQPHLVHDLTPRLVATNATTAERALLLELLVSVGHADAQRALRDALTDARLRSEPRFFSWIERLVALEAPTRETVEALVDLRARTSDSVRRAATVALGATAGARARRGDARARAHLAELVEELEHVGLTAARRDLLVALGNAGTLEVEPALLACVDDVDAETRADVAFALRKRDTRASRAALLRLAGDGDERVQAEALRVLPRHALVEDELLLVRDIVVQGRLWQLGRPAAVALLGMHVARSDAARGALAWLADHLADDPSLRVRVRSLLAQGV